MMNPQYQQKQEQNMDIISSLSSKFCYWQIYPFSGQGSLNSKKTQSQVPDVLVFKPNDALSVEVLVKNYNQLFQKKGYTFQVCESNIYLQLDDTIKNVKKKLRKENLNSIKFYLVEGNEIISNECCLTQVISNEKIIRKLHFQIKPINYSVYLDVDDYDFIEDIKYKLSLQIKRIWSKQIQPNMIEILNQKDTKDFLQNQTTIQVLIKGVDLNLPKENKNFLIIKKSEQFTFNTRTFQLVAIESKKAIDLLKMLDPDKDWKEYGLKIGDIIIKFNQIISQKCKVLFEKSLIHTKHLVGLVVKESQIFQAEKSKINIEQFKIQSIIVKNEKNQQQKSKCEKAIRDRADKAKHEYFRGNFQNIEPILLYTSQLKVRASNGRESSLFRVVNQFLRNQNFAATTQEEYKQKWEYMFQCILLNKLQKLPPIQPTGPDHTLKQGWTNKVLWRGQSFRVEYDVGQIIHFKQFTSTTEKQSVAQGFGGVFIFKITKSKSGRSIKELSIFMTQDQVLFPSYTKFVVTKKDIQYENKKKNKKIVCYEIQEVEDPPLPPNQLNFILWVDDKTGEGKKMWAEFQNFEHTTVMHQLVSTDELKKWLTINQAVYSNQKQIVNVAMISNMTRKQKGDKLNDMAGVDAIKVFRQFLPKGNIFLFIGNRKLALQKLEKSALSPSQNLQVSSIPLQLKKFLKNNIRIY